jgi:hypothetical protein
MSRDEIVEFRQRMNRRINGELTPEELAKAEKDKIINCEIYDQITALCNGKNPILGF